MITQLIPTTFFCVKIVRAISKYFPGFFLCNWPATRYTRNLEHKAVSRLSSLPTPCTCARTHTHISSQSLANLPPHCPFFVLVLAVAFCVGGANFCEYFINVLITISVMIPSISWTFCHWSTTFRGIPLNLMDLCCGSANLLEPPNPENLNRSQVSQK